MKALVKESLEKGNFFLREIEIPKIEKDQIRIKVTRAGICQTDVVYINQGGFALKPPVVLGHEIAGIIDEVGQDVEGFEVGQRVITQTTYHVCGNCQFCKKGLYNHCAERKGLGSAQNGGFAEYVVAWGKSVMAIPEELTFEQAACVEPLACGVHALAERCPVYVNEVVVVMGPGTIGLGVAQVAKAQGGTVVLAGLTSDKLRMDAALKMGIDRVVDIQNEDLEAIVKEMTEGFGADVVVEATGNVHAVDMAMRVVRRRGRFVPMGVFTTPIETDFHNIKKKELDVFGSHGQVPTAWETTLKMLQSGKLNTDLIVTHVVPMSEWEKAFQIVENKVGIKVLLDPTK
ncbi:zinc-binding dehydrogenase [Gottschalkiaceae bacterium SANA]|nr:zinc-binding dehydrogenase [Gottschalkiaceae bacterium SANA]